MAASGWLELALLAHEDYMRDLSRRGGGATLDEGGVSLYASPHPFPILINGGMREDPAVAPAEVLERARAFFGPRGRGYTIYALAGRDDDLVAYLTEAGLETDHEGTPLQVYAGGTRDNPAPAGVDVDIVRTAADVSDAVAVVATAFEVYGFPPEGFRSAYAKPVTMLAPHLAAVVAREGGEAIATAHAMLSHGIGYVSGVGVAPAAFRRGLGEVVTRAVTNAAIERGAPAVSLVASPMGASLYRRMGYEDVGALHGFVDRTTARR